jgi:hypothetical protein
MPLSRLLGFEAIETLVMAEEHVGQYQDVICDCFQLFHRRRRCGHSLPIHATPETSALTMQTFLHRTSRYLDYYISYAQGPYPRSPELSASFFLVAASLRPESCFQLQTSEKSLLTDFSTQETQRRVPTSSRHDVLNATPSEKVKETRSVPTCTGCSDVTPVQSRASHTPMPTRQRVSSGTKAPWYVYFPKNDNRVSKILIVCPSSNTLKTQRSIFPEQRWHSVD